MKIILTQEEVNAILKEYIYIKYDAKAIDISSYSPYTLEILQTTEKDK